MQYKCIRSWRRNRVGDIIEQWQYNKFERNSQLKHYEAYAPAAKKVKAIKPEPVAEIKEKPYLPPSDKPKRAPKL